MGGEISRVGALSGAGGVQHVDNTSAKSRRDAVDDRPSAAVYEEGKMAYRHPPVNWKMLIDFSKVLGIRSTFDGR